MNEIRYVAATGALGVGVDAEALNQSLGLRPHFIASDAGTTDAGPFALGSGTAAFPREAVKRDLARVLVASRKANIPALIGSAGTAGGDPHVEWVLDIAREIAEENDLSLRTAVIRSEWASNRCRQRWTRAPNSCWRDVAAILRCSRRCRLCADFLPVSHGTRAK